MLATLDLVGNESQIAISLDSNVHGIQLDEFDQTLRVGKKLQVLSESGANGMSFNLNVRCVILSTGLKV